LEWVNLAQDREQWWALQNTVTNFQVYNTLRYEDIWGSGGIAPTFLTSTLDGGELSASHPGRFIPGEIAPGTNRIGG
jgi:hypothetical protein